MTRKADIVICQNAAKAAIDKIRRMINLLDVDDDAAKILIEADNTLRRHEDYETRLDGGANSTRLEEEPVLNQLNRRLLN